MDQKTMAEWHESFSSFVEGERSFTFRPKENGFIFIGVKEFLKNISDFPPEEGLEVNVNDFRLKVKGKNPESIFAYLQKISKKN